MCTRERTLTMTPANGAFTIKVKRICIYMIYNYKVQLIVVVIVIIQVMNQNNFGF